MSAFPTLAAEALRDAARRRSLVAALLASALAGVAIHRCGSCQAVVSAQGDTVALGEIGVVSAIAVCAWIALWTYAIAALLASDGLATALEDGTAESVLTRPVSRDGFALARLAGVWLAAIAIGAALTALAVGLAAARHGVSVAPGLGAITGVAAGAWGVAAAAMALSLSLPRVATLLGLVAVGATVAAIEIAVLAGAPASGWTGAIARFGPAWIAAPVNALAPWLSEARLPAPSLWPLARSVAWAALATAGLVLRFRAVDLPR